MRISARVENAAGRHSVTLTTNERSHAIAIAPKAQGQGSGANGGELLCLALATCYCNDLYREAAKRGIAIESVEVEAEAMFGGEGEPARRIAYRARVKSDASEDAIAELMRETDRVAEIHNTLRGGCAVAFEALEPTS